MLNLRKIAVTGSLGSGKTTVCRFLQQLGACVISADMIAHQFLSLDHPVGRQVVELLGDEIVEEGEIQRKNIAKCVFGSPERLKSLEELLHPKIKQEIEKEYRTAAQNPLFTAFVAEVPLLFEAGWEGDFDLIIAVSGECRYTGQGNVHRQARQLLPEEKCTRADIIIDNNYSLDALQSEVERQVKPHLTRKEQ